MRSALGTLILVSVLIASPCGLAGDEKKVPAESATAEGTPGKAAPRMVVTVDPETGQLRPATAAERAALAAAGGGRALLRAPGATVVERFADGRVRAKLGPEYARYSIVRRNPDGTMTYDCLSEGKLDAALKAPAPAMSSATGEK